MRQRRVEVGQLIGGAGDDQRNLQALPAAATRGGAYTPTSLQRALKAKGRIPFASRQFSEIDKNLTKVSMGFLLTHRSFE